MNIRSQSALCRVCASASVIPFGDGSASHVRCRQCGAVLKDLTLDEYRALNPTYDPGYYLDGTDKQTLLEVLDVSEKVAFLRRHVAGDKPGARFLDIGCGMGGYILAAQELDFEAYGFEPSAEHSRVATEVLGLKVVREYFRSDLCNGVFDLIMVSHVIEHVFDPKAFLADIRRVLAPGGKLLVVTPNASALTAKVTGTRWPMLRPVDHVTMFTAKGLEIVAPPRTTCRVSTSEYPGEFAATLGSVLRSWARERTTAQAPAADERGSTVHTPVNATWRRGLMRLALAAASSPFFVAATIFDCRACLVAVYQA